MLHILRNLKKKKNYFLPEELHFCCPLPFPSVEEAGRSCQTRVAQRTGVASTAGRRAATALAVVRLRPLAVGRSVHGGHGGGGGHDSSGHLDLVFGNEIKL